MSVLLLLAMWIRIVLRKDGTTVTVKDSELKSGFTAVLGSSDATTFNVTAYEYDLHKLRNAAVNHVFSCLIASVHLYCLSF